jgi:tRNA(fMet)-specific endonuclease VapC
MRVLDTDILGHLFQGTPRVVERLNTVNEDPFTTIISQIELLQGRYSFLLKAADAVQLLRAQEWLDRTVDLLQRFPVIPIESRAAAQFDALRRLRKLRKIGRPDLLIASIALAHDAVLVTRNVRDFSLVPKLTIENWLE